MSIVVGEISYTNINPMFHFVDREKLTLDGCRFIPKVPAKLNRDMAAGSVHVGGISSFAYAEHSEDYVLLPNLSVSSFGAVGSIFLFSKYPITELDGKSIALTSSSATSVNLLRVILKEFYGLDIYYETMDPEYDKMMEQHDACLLIGDDAILQSWKKSEDIYQYDLGEQWYKFTGLPMTFAVFAVRKEVTENEPVLLKELYEQFIQSKKRCIDDGFEEMISLILQEKGGTKEFWKQYFNGLNNDLTDLHIQGLHRYYDLAYKLDLLPRKVNDIVTWDPTKHRHSVK